jgi:osmoprotectant transport system substrate-binding protein
MKAFEDGDIDLLPEYNGALLAYLVAPDLVPEDVTSPDEVYDALQSELPEGSETLPQSEAEDKDTLTVSQETAEKYDLQSIADLKPVADQLVVGAGPEFRERFQGLVGLKQVYGLEFEEFKPLDPGGPLTVGALEDGTIDVANIFSTDSAIEVNDWVVLEDPENLYLSQNILPLIQSDAVTPEVEEALNGVSEALTTQNLTEALARVQVDKEDPVTVAEDFLEEHGLV